MKRFLVIAALLFTTVAVVAVPAVALADSAQTSYLLSVPFQGPDAGMSGGVGYVTVPSSAQLQSVSITVADYRDGGTDQDVIAQCMLMAWNRVPLALNLVDAGRGTWTRAPDWDVNCPDSGIPYPSGFTLTKTAQPLVGDLYYSSQGVVDDGGIAIVHDILLRAIF